MASLESLIVFLARAHQKFKVVFNITKRYWDDVFLPGGLDGSSCSLLWGEAVRGLFGSSFTIQLGLLAWELDSSVAIGPGVSIKMWPICVTCGPLDIELLLDDSVKGFNRSINCGFDPDTGKFRRFNSTLRSLTVSAMREIIFSSLCRIFLVFVMYFDTFHVLQLA